MLDEFNDLVLILCGVEVAHDLAVIDFLEQVEHMGGIEGVSLNEKLS